MPLFIVRWPNLSAALVRADDEDDLLEKLDEEGNAEGCRIAEYDGPLFIDFELPVECEVDVPDGDAGPIAPEHVQVRSVDGLLERGMVLREGDCDTGTEMSEAVMRFAFPHVYREWRTGEDQPDAERLAHAVKEDALELVRTAWRREHTKRSADPAARLATQMDLPRKLAERRLQDAAPPEPTPPDAPRKGR
jgi:hypothetical protein